MRPRNKEELKKEFNLEGQSEIFFTMKVYATKSNGKLNTLKYSIDLHPPFEANNNTIEPFASPITPANRPIFNQILDNVKEVLRFVSDPLKYPLPEAKGKKGDEDYRAKPDFRRQEQEALAQAIELSKKTINHITYELNSPPTLSVGAVFRATGNGDMRPPKA